MNVHVLRRYIGPDRVLCPYDPEMSEGHYLFANLEVCSLSSYSKCVDLVFFLRNNYHIRPNLIMKNTCFILKAKAKAHLRT